MRATATWCGRHGSRSRRPSPSRSGGRRTRRAACTKGRCKVWWEACSPETDDGATVLVGLGVGVDVDEKNLRESSSPRLGPQLRAFAVDRTTANIECKAWMTDDLTYRAGTERDYGHGGGARRADAQPARRPAPASPPRARAPANDALQRVRVRRAGLAAGGRAREPRVKQQRCLATTNRHPLAEAAAAPALMQRCSALTPTWATSPVGVGLEVAARRASMSRDQFEPDVITNASACMASTRATNAGW